MLGVFKGNGIAKARSVSRFASWKPPPLLSPSTPPKPGNSRSAIPGRCCRGCGKESPQNSALPPNRLSLLLRFPANTLLFSLLNYSAAILSIQVLLKMGEPIHPQNGNFGFAQIALKQSPSAVHREMSHFPAECPRSPRSTPS